MQRATAGIPKGFASPRAALKRKALQDSNSSFATPSQPRKGGYRNSQPKPYTPLADTATVSSGHVIQLKSPAGEAASSKSPAKTSMAQRMEMYRSRATVRQRQQGEDSLQKQGTEGYNEQTSLMYGGELDDSKEEFEENLAWRINPEGRFKTFWETTKFFLLIFLFLYLPVKVSFFDDYNLIFYLGEKAIDLFFFIDVVLTFFTPVYVKVELVTSVGDIAKNYLTGWFVADLVSLIPIEDILSTQDDLPDYLQFIAKFSKIFRLLRLVKLFRLFRAFDFTNQDNYFLKLMNENFKGTIVALLLPNVILMTFTIHFFSCCWYLLAVFDDTNSNWIICVYLLSAMSPWHMCVRVGSS